MTLAFVRRMANIPLELEPLALAPIDELADAAQTGNGGVMTTAVAPAQRPPSAEEVQTFLATAQRELDTGWIDRPLWESVLAQAKGDEQRAHDAYLQTRATVLQLEKHDRRPQMSAAPAPAAAATAAATRNPSAERARKPARRPMPNARILIAGATAVAVLAAGIAFWIRSSDDESIVAASTSVRQHVVASTHPQVLAKEPVAAVAVVDDGLNARITKMVEAGNWNVVALLASEWTRREPANGQAWLQLGDGYFRLHELPEALDALTKASQLASSDAQVWRTLGHVYMQLDRPVDALQALGQAVALNASDIQSLGDVGTLNAQLTHLPEARIAFDKVLAANPDDVDATCGQAYVARQQGDAKAAEALERKVQARSQSCAGWNQRTRAVNVAGDSAVYGVVPAAGR